MAPSRSSITARSTTSKSCARSHRARAHVSLALRHRSDGPWLRGVRSAFVELRGMFAFAIYDVGRRPDRARPSRHQAAVLHRCRWSARLRLGDQVLCSTSPTCERALNGDAFANISRSARSMPPTRCSRGSTSCRPGISRHHQRRQDRRCTVLVAVRTQIDVPPGADRAYYTGRLLELLEESVRLRMVSDVPVGVFLSGGVDSTANVALMTTLAVSGVHTFTAGFKGQASRRAAGGTRGGPALQHPSREVEITRDDLVDALRSSRTTSTSPWPIQR